MKFSRRIACLLCAVIAASSISFFATAQDPKPEPKAESKTVTWKEPPAPKIAVSSDDDKSGLRELTIRDTLRLGITKRSVRGHLKDLKEDGEIDKSTSRAEKSLLVLDRLSSEDPQSFADEGLDLDSLIAFIEKMIALIERFFPS